MSKSIVKKHCSILNYVRHEDSDLYELVQDLCLGRMFNPRRQAAGVTFLHPSKALVKELQKMAGSDDPEKAVEHLQSLILVDHLPSINDFDAKKTDIPTFRGKKLPVDKVDKDKITLKGGGVVTLDKTFATRKDRSNMTVYKLDKALVPTDTADAEHKFNKPKKVTGGAVFNNDRKKLFESVVKSSCENDRNGKDSALECLVSIVEVAQKHDADKHKAICSQLSWDTLTTLAIVLQPYKENRNSDTEYVSDEMLNTLMNKYSTSAQGLENMWAYVADPHEKYMSYMNSCDVSKCQNYIHNILSNASVKSSKVTVMKEVGNAFNQLAKCDLSDLSNVRRNVLNDKTLALAECELRIMGAITLENIMGFKNYNELEHLYKKHSLTRVHMKSVNINSCNVAYYLSTASLMLNSDAFFYLPNTFSDGVTIDEWVSNVDLNVTLDKAVHNQLSPNYYSKMELSPEQKQLITELYNKMNVE